MSNDIYLQDDCTNASIASKRSLRTGITVIRGKTANKPSLVPDFSKTKIATYSSHQFILFNGLDSQLLFKTSFGLKRQKCK